MGLLAAVSRPDVSGRQHQLLLRLVGHGQRDVDLRKHGRPFNWLLVKYFFFPSQLDASSRLQSKTRKRAESWENVAEHLCFFFFFFSQRIETDSYATRLQRLHLSKGGTWDGRHRRWRRKPQRQITVPQCLHFMDDIIKLPRHDGAPVCLLVCVSVF